MRANQSTSQSGGVGWLPRSRGRQVVLPLDIHLDIGLVQRLGGVQRVVHSLVQRMVEIL